MSYKFLLSTVEDECRKTVSHHKLIRKFALMLAVLMIAGTTVYFSASDLFWEYVDKYSETQRLNVNNYDGGISIEPTYTGSTTNNDRYYTEEEQEAAAEAYYKSIGGNPYADQSFDYTETDGIVTYVYNDGSIPKIESAGSAQTYILNTSTKVFHRSGCSSAERISEENRMTAYGTSSEMYEKGYSACRNCNPY